MSENALRLGDDFRRALVESGLGDKVAAKGLKAFHELARSTDPPSSKAAAKRLEDTGIFDDHKRRVLALVFMYPGCTSAELTRFSSAFPNLKLEDRYTASRRLPDLERLGVVGRGRLRQCSAGDGEAVTWFPAGHPAIIEHEKRLPRRELLDIIERADRVVGTLEKILDEKYPSWRLEPAATAAAALREQIKRATV